MSSKTKVRSNKAQISYLCQYMASHREFAAGEFRTPQGAAQLERQWVELKAALDELGPARSVEQWKICWRDQKRKARTEGGAHNQSMNATGNSSVLPDISNNSVLVLSAIGREMATGCGPAESGIGPVPPSLSLLPAQLLVIEQAPPSPTPPPPTPPPPTPLLPAPAAASSSAQPSTARRRARRDRARNPPEQFLNAQLELNGLIKELISEVRQSNRLKEMEMKMKHRGNRRRQ